MWEKQRRPVTLGPGQGHSFLYRNRGGLVYTVGAAMVGN